MKPEKKSMTEEEKTAGETARRREFNARLEALLLKHEPHIYPKWRAMMEEAAGAATDSTGPDDADWGPTLTYAAACMAFRRVCGGWPGSAACPDEARMEARVLRGQSLLARLVVRGVFAAQARGGRR